MATARKRGKKRRCLAYVGKDAAGKRLYKSFTGDTKQEAERMAAEYELTLNAPKTVGRAVSEYIGIKAAVLSPSTIRAYRIMLKTVFAPIAGARFDTFGSADAQKWVSAMVESGKSPKYVKNAYSLLTSAIRLPRPQKPISAVLPRRTRKLSYTPTNAEIRQIMRFYDDEMQIAIMFAAYCSLRCGEICALTSADLNGNVLTVNKALVRTETGEYVQKMPKTPGSVRSVTVPGFLFERLFCRMQPVCNPLFCHVRPDQPLNIPGYVVDAVEIRNKIRVRLPVQIKLYLPDLLILIFTYVFRPAFVFE